MRHIQFLLTIIIMLPVIGFAQGYSVQSLQKINNDKGGLSGDPLDHQDRFGYAVEVIGDVDKDGIDDIAVGAYHDDDSITDQGAVYILMLNADGTVKDQQKISALAGNGPSFDDSHVWFGSSIAALGDLNGDGNVDIAVGGYGCGDDGDIYKNGAVYVLFLSDSGTVLEYNKISDDQGGGSNMLGPYDYFGGAVENIGDIDGDGLPDLAVGATSDDDAGTDRGAVYILNLNYNGTAKSYQKISDTQGNFTGTLDNSDNFGSSITSLDDLDGDGVIDIAVGAIGDDDGGTGRGAVWICFMNTDGTVKSHQKISDTQGNFTGTLDDTDYFGQSLVNLGDLDGDGISDIGVGADRDDDGGTDQGALWILYLEADGTVKSHDKIGTDDPLLDPEVSGFEYFMCDVGFFGDRNNDGKIDLVVGAWQGKEGAITSGEIYILHLEGLATYPNKQYHATPQYITASVKHSAAAGEPLYNDVGAGDHYGKSACGIGDLDGDGISDMVVGAQLSLKDGSSARRGAVYVHLLNADGSTKSYQKITYQEGGFAGTLGNYCAFGASVCSLGDLDGDGVTDIAVGLPQDDDGGANRGAVWILFLNTDGTVKSDQKISDTQGNFTGTLDNSDYFGKSVTSPGDIDGDGIQDLAVAAYLDDDGGTNKGAIWILFLDTDGTVKSEQKISDTQGNFTATIDVNDYIGYSLTSLGDLDGNGTPDICTGAIRDDDGASDGGAAYILFMSDSGYVISHKKITEGMSGFDVQVYNFDYIGNSLSGGKDFDQDGVNDLLLGSRLTDDGGTDRGAVYMLLLNTDGSVKSHKIISSTSNKLTGLIKDNDWFASSIATIDYNTQNNTAKIAIGAYVDDDGATDAGSAYVVAVDLMSTYDPSLTSGRIHRSNSDLNRNWTYGESYDENGNIIGASKQYVDELGKNTQSLTLNIDKNRVLTVQTIYDKHGRPAVNTMPAPTGLNMVYKDSFVTDVSGNIYAYTDFDSNNTLNDPDSVGSNFPNSLGDYYSANGEDDYLATSAFPYSRIEYMADPTERVKRSSAAGENFKMGSGHEGRIFYMYTGGELDRAFGVDSSYYCQTSSTDRLQSRALSNTEIVAKKTISVDPEGEIAITFKSGGLAIAMCVSGMTPTDSVPEQPVSNTMLYAGTQSVNIHLPKARSTTLKLVLPEYEDNGRKTVGASEIIYKLMDLESNSLLTEGDDNDYTINSSTRLVTFIGANKHRFLRISYTFTATKLTYFEDNSITPPDADVEYTLDYSQFTANYYDLAGRLRMTISPKGFDYSVNGKHDEFSKYDYDPYGQLIAKETPDEGLVEYLYSDEGMLRFSQNAQQGVDDKFSYVRYDDYNRSIESGEYQENGAGTYEFANYYQTAGTGIDVADVVDDVDFVFTSQTSDEKYIAYDLLPSSDEIPAGYTFKSQYPQHNLKARVSKTWNDNNQTWYSYDYAGRPEYSVQELIDTDFSSTKDSTVKTVEYTYAPVTSVLEKEVFQKNHTTEKLTHEYTYNDNLQLLTATAKDNSNNTVGEAAFEYYINGQLKRKEIGGELQGIDYVYTLHGQLKSINHPSLYDAYDPGEDGKTGSTNATFEADVFGMALDYYEDDYTRTGSNIISSVTTATDGYNNGLIKATRWKIKGENEIGSTPVDVLYTAGSNDKELMYNYTYDNFYRFETATFGVFDNDTTSNAFAAKNDFKVFGTSDSEGVDYDIIGNITDLNRNGYDGTPGLLMDSLSYTYTSGKSQLASIVDNSSSTYTTDFETTGSDAFTYNSLGQMTASDADDVSSITYMPTGQVKKVTFNSTGNTAEYFYNERNIKIKSKFIDVGASSTKYNWYITDASGALKSVHERTDAGSVSLTNQAVYGGGRLGMYDKNTSELNYEITDHLGNVRLTIRDSSTSGTAKVEVLSWADYYPFGEVLPGRNSNPTGMFGYQGQERVSNGINEVSGSRWYNFNLRMYNPSLGRFNSIDPYSQFNSPYLAMANNPISFVDPDGGRAILTPQQVDKINRRLMLAGRNELSRREWLAIWMSTNQKNHYKQFSLEGLNAVIVSRGVYGLEDYLLNLGGGFTDSRPGGFGPPRETGWAPLESDKSTEFYIDGLKVTGLGFMLFAANTIRENIVDASTNVKGLSNQSIIDMFGKGESNYDRGKRERKEAAQEKKDAKKAKEDKQDKEAADDAKIPEITSTGDVDNPQNEYHVKPRGDLKDAKFARRNKLEVLGDGKNFDEWVEVPLPKSFDRAESTIEITDPKATMLTSSPDISAQNDIGNPDIVFIRWKDYDNGPFNYGMLRRGGLNPMVLKGRGTYGPSYGWWSGGGIKTVYGPGHYPPWPK